MDVAIRAATTTASVASSTASAGSSTASRPPVYHVVGIILAVCSGVFIGISFVLKKTGLLKANVKYHEEAGDGYGYLKNAWWWSGMTLMIIGEICNFVAYAFVDAILVTPLGALSVVITTILSAIFLKERLSFVGKVGCFNCIIGSVVIVLNSPAQSSAANIQEMQNYVISPGFLTYAGVIVVGCAIIALWAGPRYGKKSMLVYLSICSLIGGLSVVATQGLGAAIVTQIGGTPQFNHWFIYVLLIFVISTLVTEIIYLNKALNLFNAALVTPTYYVYFTSSTIVTSAILFRGFKGTPIQITTIIMGFLVICSGVILLQLSKSAKDVPDAAVFKGDLDQMRTVAEQQEHMSEPKADAIRGAAGLLRSFSRSHMRREAEEAKRIQEERMESIGENEQVEWDGLRRRKTILGPGQSPILRRKTLHPPLGMAHFPDETDADHADEDTLPGLFPNLRKRTHTIFHPHDPSRRSTTSSGGSGRKRGPGATRVTMTDISPALSQRTTTTTTNDDLVDPYRPHIFGLPPGLQRNNSTSLNALQAQDTAYNGPGQTSIHWGSRTAQPSRESTTTTTTTPGPTPPPHIAASGASSGEAGGAKRQFSFQNVFLRHGHGQRPTTTRGEDQQRPTSSSSRGSVLGLRRATPIAKMVMGTTSTKTTTTTTTTEEERLGLVKGDSQLGGGGGDGAGSGSGSGSVRRVFSPAKEEDEEEDEGLESDEGDVEKRGWRVGQFGRRRRSRRRRRRGRSDDFDEDGFDDGTSSGSDLGEYARVVTKELDRDDGQGPSSGGAAFV